MRSLGLGMLSTEPQLLKSGLFSQVWRVDTEQSYIIKIISRSSFWKDSDYDKAGQIALFFKNQGIPAIPACFKKIGEYRLLVYPYIVGDVLPLTAASPEQAQRIGHCLGRMHHCAKAQSSAKGLILSHRDLNPQNVIWDAHQQPHIIDWEWAGEVDPDVEVIHTALMWAGLMAAEFNKATYQAFLAGYAASGETITQAMPVLLDAIYYIWEDWLALIKKSDSVESDKNQAIQKTINTLNFIHQNTAVWKTIY